MLNLSIFCNDNLKRVILTRDITIFVSLTGIFGAPANIFHLKISYNVYYKLGGIFYKIKDFF